MNNGWIRLLPEEFARKVSFCQWEKLEEIRMRVGQPLELRFAEEERSVSPIVTTEHLEEVLRRACHQSVYSCTETLKDGYVTVEGGHRIGICGTVVRKDGAVHTIRDPSSLAVRIARQVKGCADSLISRLNRSLLILGPPGTGKTTLLRDALVGLSDCLHQRVGLVDERGELAATVRGVPQLFVGRKTDVLVNVKKADGIMMLLRTMNPQWIAVDEITAPADIAAMEQASYCGVRLIATAHGAGKEDLYCRPLYRSLMESGIFSAAVILNEQKQYQWVELEK